MKRFWNWLRPPQRRLVLIRRFSSRLRLADFRSSKDLVESARKFLMDPEFQPLIEVLRNECPSGNIIIDPTLPVEARAVLQARAEGYQIALTNLFAMGTYEEPQKPLEASFEQPEEDMP